MEQKDVHTKKGGLHSVWTCSGANNFLWKIERKVKDNLDGNVIKVLRYVDNFFCSSSVIQT